MLVQGPGDGQILAQGEAGNGGDQGGELGDRGRVALDAAVGLLEDQCGGKRQRPLLRPAVAEQRTDDEYRLGMDPAAEVHLALDIEHLAAAEARGGGDPRRQAEAVLAEGVDGQAVDLAHSVAIGRDQGALAEDLLPGPLLPLAAATVGGLDGRAHVLRTHLAGAVAAGQEVRLREEIAEVALVEVEAAAVAGAARGELHAACDTAASDGQKAVAPLQRGEELGKQPRAFVRARHVRRHVGGDLEQGGELRVVLLQQVAGEVVAQQHDLEVQRYRLRFELNGAREAEHLVEGLDADLPRPQRALERRPGEGTGKDLLGL